MTDDPHIIFFYTGHRGSAGWVIEPGSDCWLWQGTTNADGYPIVRMNSRLRAARRAVYERHHGQELKPVWHLYLKHGCPRRCVNPDHMTPVKIG